MSKENKKRRKALGRLPTKERCIAHNRFGEPCKRYPVEGAVVCASHGGLAPQVKRKAQERIMMAQDDAAPLLVRFMNDEKVPWGERRRCAEFLLNYDSRNEIHVTLAKWEEDIEGLIYESQDIVEAEVVEDEPRAIPPSDREWRSEVLSAEDSEPSYIGGNRYRGG